MKERFFKESILYISNNFNISQTIFKNEFIYLKKYLHQMVGSVCHKGKKIKKNFNFYFAGGIFLAWYFQDHPLSAFDARLYNSVYWQWLIKY